MATLVGRSVKKSVSVVACGHQSQAAREFRSLITSFQIELAQLTQYQIASESGKNDDDDDKIGKKCPFNRGQF